ncbi:peptide-methionine (R)-S-oxide reductase MsrB [Flagellimonas zhangzhouensis]|uniref:peptide-methionine (R)-S-oxide reductase n=1 Tax=Flagellimonas zhangzhouensis TaxID=1073328 RepID=A0A1H2XZA2_9FLAO|nr:peptide-methionine (R)-S-oxide reductase MsrB [Allomuricauda zhangzhouensis]SDQ93077.1 peptide-methionine (R)-S-oxide reductase [Allomuricauda zhangzhouensis]SDW97764.1 peptide-methionine (R)-S-oxide reductase [Allomuricauda zhangzhouensis]
MDKKYGVAKTEAEWKEQLSAEEYYVLRQKGTERPHTGEFDLHFENGDYFCKACNAKLFESEHKFHSGCGWPSFDEAVEGAIEYIRDTSHGMIRTETVCANCGSHLGHVFNDGPRETTGMRYCINSVSIDFDPET